MTTFVVTDPETGKKLRLTGDSPPTEAELEELFAQYKPQTEVIEPNSNYPGSGFIEPAMTMATGALAEPVSGLVGLSTAIATGDSTKGADMVQVMKEKMTYAPKTEAGQEGLQSVAEFVEPVTNAFTATEDFLGDTVFELTGSPEFATAAKSSPTALLEALGLVSLKSLRNGVRLVDKSGLPTKALRKQLNKHGLVYENLTPEAKSLIPKVADKNFIPGKTELAKPVEKALIQQLKSGGRDDALAGLKLVGNRVVDDDLAKAAIKQGFEPGFVRMVDTATPATKLAMKKQLSILRRGKANFRNANDARMTEITGNSLRKRLLVIGKEAKKNRKELDQIAKSKLAGKSINPKPVVETLRESLRGYDIYLDDWVNQNRRLPSNSKEWSDVFRGSMISKDRTSQRIIKDAVDLLSEGDLTNAQRWHKLKRQIDTMVDFNKKSAGGLTDAGKNVLKDIRYTLNQELRAIDPDYARVNDVLHESLGLFEDIQSSMSGKKIDIFSKEAPARMGLEARKIFSNYNNAPDLKNVIERIDGLARKYGGKFDDDVVDIAAFARLIEDRFGTLNKTSLQGELKTSVEQATKYGPIHAATDAAANKVGDLADQLTGVNDFKAFEAMEDLLNR